MFTVSGETTLTIDTIGLMSAAPKDCLFFDIETTGFSPKTTICYLIGAISYDDGMWRFHQWFAENIEDECNIIKQFLDLVSTKKYLIHFNGEGFDIPYIMSKCEKYDFPNVFSSINSIDLFKIISHHKKMLKLDNYKQKTIEKFLDVNRVDIYSGGDLINVYNEFLETGNRELINALIIHNYEDILGLTAILPAISYNQIRNHMYSFVNYDIEGQEIIFTFSLSVPLPKRVSMRHEDFYLTAYGNTLKLRVKIYTNELKYFYSNYKDYYYLPNEDMAIHKSVAFYVDKNFRTKAKAATCYSRKTGKFLPQLTEIFNPYFKIDYFDKIMYFEMVDEFLSSPEDITKYCNETIQYIL